MEKWITDLLLNVAAGVTIAAILGATAWVTWVSRKIPSFTGDVKDIKKSLSDVVTALKAIPQVQAAMTEHEKDDAALFADLEARMRGVERKAFGSSTERHRHHATSQA